MVIKFNAQLTDLELESLVTVIANTTGATCVSGYSTVKAAMASEIAEEAINKIIEDEDIFINEDTLFEVTDETAFTISEDKTSLDEFKELAHDTAMDVLKKKSLVIA